MAWHEVPEDLYWAFLRWRRNKHMVGKHFPTTYQGHEVHWNVDRKDRFYTFVTCNFGPGPYKITLSYGKLASAPNANWNFVWHGREYHGPTAPLDLVADFLSGPDLNMLDAYLRADELCTMVRSAYEDKHYSPGRVRSAV